MVLLQHEKREKMPRQIAHLSVQENLLSVSERHEAIRA